MGSATRICDFCGAVKRIKPNSIYHKSPKCLKCFLPKPNIQKFNEYLKETNWSCLDTPTTQNDKIMLTCQLCQHQKVLNYKSFISKRIDCGHPAIKKNHQIKGIIESLGFTTIIIPIGSDSKTPLETRCHHCKSQLVLSIAEMRDGCPKCKSA